jgi:hypothetical protein
MVVLAVPLQLFASTQISCIHILLVLFLYVQVVKRSIAIIVLKVQNGGKYIK